MFNQNIISNKFDLNWPTTFSYIMFRSLQILISSHCDFRCYDGHPLAFAANNFIQIYSFFKFQIHQLAACRLTMDLIEHQGPML